MSNPFGDGAGKAVHTDTADSALPSRDVDTLLRALPDDDSRTKYGKHCAKIAKALSGDERVVVLAVCVSGKPGVLALTNKRTLFVYKADALTPMSVVGNALTNISATRPARDGLILTRQDTGKDLGFRMTPELGQAFVREMNSLGVAEGGQKAAAPASPHGPLGVLPEKTKKVALQHIASNEWVFLVFVGAKGQSLIALADRLLIVKTGFMAGNTFGGQASTFPYREITGVDIQTHMSTAVLQVQTASFAGISPSYWSNDKSRDPFKLPNCIPLQSKKVVTQWQANLATLRRGIAAGGFVPPRQPSADVKQPVTTAKPSRGDPPTGEGSLSAELKKLAELRDTGVLDDQEFAQAKAKLLG